MNYSGILHNDICNGEGVRVTLFVSGCKNNCEGCHNPETHDYNYGQEFDNVAKMEIENDLKSDICDGLTLTGGDPLDGKNCNDSFYWWLKSLKKKYPDKTIWCYTGMLWETLCDHDCVWDTVRECVDVLVDGRYINELEYKHLVFRGSANQRIIDVKKTLENDRVTLWTPIKPGEKALGHKLSIADPIILHMRDFLNDVCMYMENIIVPIFAPYCGSGDLNIAQEFIRSSLKIFYIPITKEFTELIRELTTGNYEQKDVDATYEVISNVMIQKVPSLLRTIPNQSVIPEITVMMNSKFNRFNAQYDRLYSQVF